LKARYRLGISDAAVVTAVVNYLRETHDSRLTSEWTDTNILGALGGHSVFNWFVFEEAARDLYWHIWRTDTRSMLHCYLVDKPRDIKNVVLEAMKTESSEARHPRGLRYNPLEAVSVMIAVPGLIFACAGRARLEPAVGGVLILLAFSMVPGFLFYPVVHTMMGVFMSIALALYLALSLLLSTACRFAWPRPGAF